MINIQFDAEKYEACWFEIRTCEKTMVMRDREKFLRKSKTLSQLEEVRLYRIEKSPSGLRKLRVPAV